MLKVFGYYLVFTPLSTYLGNLLVDRAHWNEYLVEALSMIVNFVTEFLFQRFFVFGKTIDTNDRAKKAAEKADGETEEPSGAEEEAEKDDATL